eukprot:NODE_248_length_12985_cov_0.286357.p13 type:complete len:106 gc:universal NODE_248_length_12985_cov_0.286357:9011-8694(-)
MSKVGRLGLPTLGIAGPLIQALIAALVAYKISEFQSSDKEQVQKNILDREIFMWLRDLYSGEAHHEFSESVAKSTNIRIRTGKIPLTYSKPFKHKFLYLIRSRKW